MVIRLFSLLAAGAAVPAIADTSQTVYAPMAAHPALWTVHGAKGTAYLLGSVHILPPQVDWHTKEIDAAIARTDIFVFELPLDGDFQGRVQTYVRDHGLLPAKEHLRDLLSPEARTQFDAAIAGLPIPPAAFDRMRPWLADLTIDVMGMGKSNYATQAGVEVQLRNMIGHRPVIGLETIEQQMAILAPTDPKVEIQEFEADLKQAALSRDEVGPLLDAWMHGDVRTLARLTQKGLKASPQMRKILLDDRNRAWTKQIIALLDQDEIYFITVGAGHLAGPVGVPALLRAAGVRVEGP